jgi:hypothetical protein
MRLVVPTWLAAPVVAGRRAGNEQHVATVTAEARRPWWTIAAGAGTELVMIFAAIASVTPFLGPMRNRPPG